MTRIRTLVVTYMYIYALYNLTIILYLFLVFLGCYFDQSQAIQSGLNFSYSGMTVEYCVGVCYSKNYFFAALQNG